MSGFIVYNVTITAQKAVNSNYTIMSGSKGAGRLSPLPALYKRVVGNEHRTDHTYTGHRP